MKQLILGLIIMISTTATAISQDKVVIAHRGASGYLPEHTIAAKAMAYAMGADYIEQDVVMTKDDHLVVLHDHYLDRVTDVQEKFPNRKREDGRYYVIDFTLDEIRTLDISERYRINDDGKKIPVFPDRFPLNKSRFKVHTFEEEIELVQGLNKSKGGDIGIYPEAKSPAFHLQEGKDLSKAILVALKNYGYRDKNSKVYYQTFEIEELKRVHDDLLPALGMDIKLIQLMGEEDYYHDIITAEGLKILSEYADGIGPSIGMIIPYDAQSDTLKITNLVSDAHASGMKVHPYTFRQERMEMPGYAKNYEDLLDIFFNRVGVDGVFSDFPDRTLKFLGR